MSRTTQRTFILAWAASALLLSACAATTPAQPSRATAPAAVSGVERWFDPESLRLLALLPPVPDAAATRQELDLLLSRQAQRSEAACLAADEDANKKLSRFAVALGLQADASDPRLEAAGRILENLRMLQERITNRVKDATNRPRPFRQDARVTTCIERPMSDSYPSGHATFGMAAALLLADMVPERRAELLARGIEYGEQRVVGGVHFPSDVAAGRTAGTVIAAFLLASPQYQNESASARAGLRSALGLPPTPQQQH
jgi:acid phosphatase (class A)